MRRKKQIVISIILVLTIVGLIWLSRPADADEAVQAILVLKRPLQAGICISAEDVEVRLIPARIAPENCLSAPAQAIGQWTISRMDEGEWVFSSRVTSNPTGQTFALVDKGRRLMTLAFEAKDANGFWLSIGNRIDLHLIPRTQTDENFVRILPDVRIVNLIWPDGNTAAPADGSVRDPLVCVDVSEAEAAILAAAQSGCDIRLAVVSP